MELQVQNFNHFLKISYLTWLMEKSSDYIRLIPLKQSSCLYHLSLKHLRTIFLTLSAFQACLFLKSEPTLRQVISDSLSTSYRGMSTFHECHKTRWRKYWIRYCILYHQQWDSKRYKNIEWVNGNDKLGNENTPGPSSNKNPHFDFGRTIS